MICETTVYEEGNCLGSVDARLCHDVQMSQENCKVSAPFVPIYYEKLHVAGLSQDDAFLAEKQ
jgi:hypothetical protein